MDGTWWMQRQELDTDQQSIISLPVDGRYLIVGPPGSGKTNLLVLRAAFLAKSGFVDQIFLTFGGVLSAFITTGAKELQPQQISTYSRWARRLAGTRLPDFANKLHSVGENLGKRQRFIAERSLIASECLAAISAPGYASQVHQAIHIDEVQDLFSDELKSIASATPRLMAAGDSRQSIYHGNGIEIASKLGFEVYTLTRHYRIGTAIAKIADRLHPPRLPEESLALTTKYDETTKQSRAEYQEFPNRQAQFDAMLLELRSQIRAYPNEPLAVFIARRAAFDELRILFSRTDLYSTVAFHENADVINFSAQSRIHVLTIAGAKGTEFRAVHLFACEDAQGPQDSVEFWYTAVTRAKTTLLAYSSPSGASVSRKLLGAFAVDQKPTIDSLFA